MTAGLLGAVQFLLLLFELLEDDVAIGGVRQGTASFVLLQCDDIPDLLLQLSGLDTSLGGPVPALQLVVLLIKLLLQLIFTVKLDVWLGDLLHELVLAIRP